MRRLSFTATLSALALTLACHPDRLGPDAITTPALAAVSWGPETPHFNLEVILRGAERGFGHVEFRQPNDDMLVIQLDTWVRDLEPNTAYQLQRAVDTNLDGACTSAAWLTLGKGAAAQAIVTDDRGTGREQLFRSVSAFPVGASFDIHFQVIDAITAAVVLQSECYRFTISQ